MGFLSRCTFLQRFDEINEHFIKKFIISVLEVILRIGIKPLCLQGESKNALEIIPIWYVVTF